MKKFLSMVFFASVLMFGSVLKAYSFVETVAGIGVVATALNEVLDNVIDKVSGEVKDILNQAKSEAMGLESTIGSDLFRLEDVLIADIERLTGNTLNQADNMLQASLADITRLEARIDVQMAKQIRDAVHLANVTWKNVAKDAERLVVKIEQGTAVIVDSSLIQLVRIITLICAFAVLIVGVIVLIKNRVPGIVVASVGLLIVIFCFTPLFPALVSNWSKISEVVKLDDSIDPPQILVVSPASLKFNDKGQLEILGMNFLPKTGSSRLMVGRDANHLSAEGRASVQPNKISVPLESFTKASGLVVYRIERDDGQKSADMTLYVQKPEQIPIRISYTIWQSGIWSSQSAGYYQVRKTLDEHGWGDTKKNYYETYAPVSMWTSTGFTKNEISVNHRYDLTENLSGTGLQINYSLKSGPWWDQWRGWYNADYTITLMNTNYGDTRGLAEHGEKTLYFDEETGEVSAVRNSVFQGLGISSYEMKLGGKIFAKGAPVIAVKKRFNMGEVLYRSMTSAGSPVIRRSAFKSMPLPQDVRFKPLTGGSNSQVYFLKPFQRRGERTVLNITLPQENTFRMTAHSQTVFELGQAPSAPGFQPQQTWYDIAVVFGDSSESMTGKTGQTAVHDSQGNLLMTLYTDAQGKLFMTWMHE